MSVSAPNQTPQNPRFFGPLILASLAAGLFWYLLNIPMNWDSAAYLDLTSRWLHGAKLYRDIEDINPPLIFFETAALTAGQCTKQAFIGGTCIILLLSALWCRRLRGDAFGIIAFIAMAVSGIQHFGQRDHLAIIFLMPYLASNNKTNRVEQLLLGIFAFAGLGLKPYFLVMPAFASIASALTQKSIRPLFSTANWTIGGLCIIYVAAALILYPTYFTEMIPGARDIYFAFNSPTIAYRPLVWLCLVATPFAFLTSDPYRLRMAAALVGALVSYFVQSKGFPYQASPAVCLALVTLADRLQRDRLAISVSAATLIASFIAVTGFIGPYRSQYEIGLPRGTKVLVLSDHVSASYPEILEGGLINVTMLPVIMSAPGAVVIQADPNQPASRKLRVKAILESTRARLLNDVRLHNPDYSLVDRFESVRFGQQKFDWYKWLAGEHDLVGYEYAGEKPSFIVYRRRN